MGFRTILITICFFSDYKKNIDRFYYTRNILQLKNHDFSMNLYVKLSTKYYCRDQLVVISTRTKEHHDAYLRVIASCPI